jgi:CRP/FNR family transcriptional regulator, cyclic AMP receptor protein
MSQSASKQLLEDLRAVPLFSACTDKELSQIKRLADEVIIPAETVIVRQGAFGQEAYVLLSGSVSVTVSGSEVATLTDGAYFGELAPLDHLPRSATVTATTEVRTLVFNSREFSTLLTEHAAVNRKLLADYAHRLRELSLARAS